MIGPAVMIRLCQILVYNLLCLQQSVSFSNFKNPPLATNIPQDVQTVFDVFQSLGWYMSYPGNFRVIYMGIESAI